MLSCSKERCASSERVRIQRYDGDSLYLLSIKEMCTVLDCMKIHPIATLLGGKGGALSPSVKMSSEMAVMANNWLEHGMTKSLSEYKKAAGL